MLASFPYQVIDECFRIQPIVQCVGLIPVAKVLTDP